MLVLYFCMLFMYRHPLDTLRKFNVNTTFRKHCRRLLNIFSTLNLRPVSRQVQKSQIKKTVLYSILGQCLIYFGNYFNQNTFFLYFLYYITMQNMKFSIKDFFSKCNQICSKLRIQPHLLGKSLNFIFLCSFWNEFGDLLENILIAVSLIFHLIIS